MSYVPTAYDDQDHPHQMATDCVACSGQQVVHLPEDSQTTGPANQVHVRQPEISVPPAVADMASTLHLHLD